jgi:Cu2+-exporting ATPase
MSSTSAELGCPSNLTPPRENKPMFDPAPFMRVRDGINTLELSVSGAKCAGCISKIEGTLLALPGIQSARLNLSTKTLSIAWTGELTAGAVRDAVTGLGYDAVPFDPKRTQRSDDAEGRLLLRCLAVAGFASANIMLLSVAVWSTSGAEMGEATRAFLHLASALIAIPATAFAGRPFFASAWRALKNGHANMDVPISLAVFLAVGVSLFESMNGGEHAYFDAAVMLLFFLLIGRWLDHRLRQRARSAAHDLLALTATTALRRTEFGDVEAVMSQDIKPGDQLILTPGARLPVNGEVIEGRSDIDTAFLTGESLPQVAESGTQLYAGTRNISARMTVRATADVDGSLVAEIVRLVEAGQQAKDRYTVLADKAARLYVPLVHTLAALTFLGWLFLAGGSIREAVMAATAVLIITCPCALGLATPAVQVVATSQLFRRGILVKSGNALERLSRIKHIAFDKTGTLTMGQLTWTNPDDLTAEDRATVAAIARAGLHPIARSIAAASGPGPLAEDATETPGEGLEGLVEGRQVLLGRREFVGAEVGLDEPSGPHTWLRIGSSAPIQLRFQDTIHNDCAQTVERMRAAGLGISLLSGDGDKPVVEIADAAGITDHHANLRPEEKAAAIAAHKTTGPVAMVGDGINDAAALALADVSLSPGTAADAAQSAADFVFQKDGITAVFEAWRMAVRARRHILQNFAFAAAYNAVAAPAAMAGLVSPLVAALAMSGSSLVVTLNALRLTREAS